MSDSGWPKSPLAIWSKTANPDGSRTLITWSKDLDLTDELRAARASTRQGVLDGMAEIRSSKAKRQTKHATARAAYERLGDRNIERPDRDVCPGASRTCIARIYYVSTGGEILCFDSQPLTVLAAEQAISGHKMRKVYNPKYRARGREPEHIDAPPQSDAYDAEVVLRSNLGADATAQGLQTPKHGARLVVLPSQKHKPVETVVEPDDFVTSLLDIASDVA